MEKRVSEINLQVKGPVLMLGRRGVARARLPRIMKFIKTRAPQRNTFVDIVFAAYTYVRNTYLSRFT